MDGAKMKEMREFKNMGQRELAENVGVSIAFISQLENGLKECNSSVLKRIADALKCTTDELLGR